MQALEFTNSISDIRRLQWQHNSAGYELIRVFLGVALLVRGIWFLVNPQAIGQIAGVEVAAWAGSIAAIAHIAGGLLLTVGLLTRIGALVQIPILLQAVFVVHGSNGLSSPTQSLELSSLVLVLLLVVLVFGAGRFSVDYWLAHRGDG